MKEHPNCRKVILRDGILPYIVGGVWDNFTVVGREGRYVGLSDNMRLQIRKMVREGVWGDVRVDRRVLKFVFSLDLTKRPTEAIDPSRNVT